MVLVIDYGVGNVGSIRKMLLKSGTEVSVSAEPHAIETAKRFILPGVGAFDDAMSRLEATGLLPVLERRVRDEGVPVLGICLGMQMLTRGSEEGTRPGLGWIDADTVRLADGADLRVPHIGWNAVDPNGSKLFRDIRADDRFYFMHSFKVRCDDVADVAAESEYGGRFACAIQRDNVHGVQFHPEKSHGAGLRLLATFAGLN